MRRPIIPAALAALTLLAAAACGPSREETARADAQAAEERATAAARQAALRDLHDVEASIAGARKAIQAGESGSPTRADALHVSEIRRAIVVANVAVQKAREALGREDYATAQQALKGAAARLRDVVSGKAGRGGQEPKPGPGGTVQDLPGKGRGKYADAATGG